MKQESKGFFEGSSNGIFVFGLVTGIAVALIINSISFAGGLKIKKNGESKNTDTAVVVDPSAGAVAAGDIVLAPVTEDDHIIGDIKEAKVIMIEYSDFECPFCERHHPTLQQVVDAYGDDVAWVYRHLPLSFHPQATPAALASECAADQGKFWEYSDELFANQSQLGEDLYLDIASDIGLNIRKFETCLSDQTFATDVAEDLASAQAAGANGTPATFINGQLVSGAVPYTNITQIIDGLLAQ